MDIRLTAQVRKKTGKGVARSLRRQKWIPAVSYGPKSSPVALSIPSNELEKALNRMGSEANKIIDLTMQDGDRKETRQVMIRDLQIHPYRRKFIHVDFYEVPLNKPIEAEVPVELQGTAAGAVEGGIVNQIRWTLTVRCLPSDIPDSIPIDISSMQIGDSIHVEDLVQQVSFELVDDGHFTVVTLNAPAAAEPEEVVEEAAEAEESTEGEEVEE